MYIQVFILVKAAFFSEGIHDKLNEQPKYKFLEQVHFFLNKKFNFLIRPKIV